jgi:hypothetical protein
MSSRKCTLRLFHIVSMGKKRNFQALIHMEPGYVQNCERMTVTCGT